MADAPKILDTDYLDEAYPKINKAIDNANEALNTASTALNNSTDTQQQLENIVIPVEKTTFVKIGKNHFNKNAVTPDRYVLYSTGSLVSNSSYVASDWIPVKPTTDYTRNQRHQLAFYDAKKNYISGINGAGTTIETEVFTTPSNAAFVRITVSKTLINQFQLELGTAETQYEEFKLKIKNLDVPVVLNDGEVIPRYLSDYSPGKNLFDKNAVTLDRYVNANGGILSTNTAYVASDWIEVDPDTVYTRSYAHQMAFYNENKNFISGINSGSASPLTFTTPSNAKYMRLTVAKTVIETFQVERGSVATTYEPFGKYYLRNLAISANKNEDEFLLFLPDEICIAVGRTIELYNSQVSWTGNINNFHFKWECNVGRSMKRKWSCEGTSNNIGEYALNVTVYNNNMEQVVVAQTTVRIVSNLIANEVKVLPIGDSLSNAKPWYAEVISLSENKISYVGTRWNGDVQGGVKNHEGRSGATAGWYLSNGTYTFEANGVTPNNPFYNPETGKFDFAYYKETYNIYPDATQIFLGTNGISLDPTTNANNIKAIVDGIRESDPDMKLFIVYTLYRGDQNGIGNQTNSDGFTTSGGNAWKLEEDRKVFNLMVRLNDLLKDYPNLYFIPVSLTHDSENNFKDPTPRPVNPRSSITEYQDAEATHPRTQPAGYLQMADIMYSTYCAHINE